MAANAIPCLPEFSPALVMHHSSLTGLAPRLATARNARQTSGGFATTACTSDRGHADGISAYKAVILVRKAGKRRKPPSTSNQTPSGGDNVQPCGTPPRIRPVRYPMSSIALLEQQQGHTSGSAQPSRHPGPAWWVETAAMLRYPERDCGGRMAESGPLEDEPKMNARFATH